MFKGLYYVGTYVDTEIMYSHIEKITFLVVYAFAYAYTVTVTRHFTSNNVEQ